MSMTIDNAIGKLYIALNKCRDTSEYVDGLLALRVMEEAASALENSQKILVLTSNGEFDKELHGQALQSAFAENQKLLMP